MKSYRKELWFEVLSRRGFINITPTIEECLRESGVKEGVTCLVDIQNQHSPSDFISIDQARKQILLQTGRTVSHSTAARWVAQNNLGHKLSGHKGQWIVDVEMFGDFILDVLT